MNKLISLNKVSFSVYMIKIFDYICKFSFLLLIPILYSFELVGEINLFLSYLALQSCFFSLGLNTSVIKKVSSKKLNKNQIIVYFTKCILLIFIFSIFFFFIFYLLNLHFKFYYHDNFKLLLYLFLSSLSFCITSLISSFLRGLGKFYTAQVIIGILWYFPLILILVIDNIYIGKISDLSDFIKIVTVLLLLNAFTSASILFNKFKKINFKIPLKHSTKINFNIFHYLDVFFSQIYTWIPIIIFSFYMDSVQLGILSTYYRLGIFLIGSLSLIEFIISKDVSFYFAKQKYDEIVNIFKKFKKIQTIILIINTLFLIIGIVIINYFIKRIVYFDLNFVLFFCSIILGLSLGPVKSILLYTRFEKEIISIKFLILILIFILIKINFLLEKNSSYILNIMGFVILIDYVILHLLVKMNFLKRRG